jgi:flagellar hook assembly protein FlgD
VVRTLVPMASRAAGTYTDPWNGKNDAGQAVTEGIYQAVLLYEVDGVVQRLDLSTTTGGTEYSPSRTSLPTSFQPFDNNPLTVDFTLDVASEVTAFVGSFNVNSRYTTFFTRQPFGRGTHRITWNGENTDGQLIKPAPGDSFLWGLFGYRLSDNAIVVRNSAQLSALSASPPIFDPTGIAATGTANRNAITFTLTAPASAELMVQDTVTGVVVNRIVYSGLTAGANTLAWDGKARDGRYVAPGTYRLGVTPIQANGFRALSSYVLQRVFY